jgi:hypothetical protein
LRIASGGGSLATGACDEEAKKRDGQDIYRSEVEDDGAARRIGARIGVDGAERASSERIDERIFTAKFTRVLSVRLSSPGRHPKTSGFDVAEGRI